MPDTRNKRASVINLARAWARLRPTPDASLANKEDRRHLVAQYAGFETPSPSPELTGGGIYPEARRRGRR